MMNSSGDVGVMLPRDLPANDVIVFAQRAEDLGFDELWVVEDLGFRGGIAQAAAVLASTTRITVGVGILPAGSRNVAFAAMEIATLEELFPGRVVIGIGHGMPDWMRSVGAWPGSPLTLLREYTIALTTLLRGEPGPAAGRYVDVSDVRLATVPDTPPPIVWGVRGPKSLAAAGDVADGIVLAEPATPEYIRASSETAGVDAARAGRAPRLVTYDIAAVEATDADARDVVRSPLGVIGESDWFPHIAPLPFASEFAALRERAGTAEAFAAALPDEWIDTLALAGTAERVRAGIAARHAAGATCVVLTPIGSDSLRALENLAAVLRAQ
ncbi:LLM class flavin-dependent oxidoreductase [Rathayibacter sp. AY2B3]|uniref:LLM class flavin-dependent oxidoreductase n=1 Tax=Rathayibacter sp. AY2B3 TaxID=2080569 RepID=UPI002158040A|nr:LLM class flavin-dependent oxidoreductase [Rathayibacter sp. AY2B3]